MKEQYKLILCSQKRITTKVYMISITLGILFDDLKKYEDAIRCYDEVIKLDPNDS